MKNSMNGGVTRTSLAGAGLVEAKRNEEIIRKQEQINRM